MLEIYLMNERIFRLLDRIQAKIKDRPDLRVRRRKLTSMLAKNCQLILDATEPD
jgi:hypothetical protein